MALKPNYKSLGLALVSAVALLASAAAQSNSNLSQRNTALLRGGSSTPPAVQDDSTCSQYTDCSGCMSSGCGWCKYSGTCMAGSALGPTSGTCTAGEYCSSWFFGTTCPDQTACTAHGDCSTCLADTTNQCGWCNTTKSCSTGCAFGPYINDGNCPSGDYFTAASPRRPPHCGAASDCSLHTSCSECSSKAGCGWCKFTSTCVHGDAAGPATGTCSPGLYCSSWFFDTCPDQPACTAHTDCSSCIVDKMNHCGWCNATNTCSSGCMAGPYINDGTCSTGQYFTIASPHPPAHCKV